VASGSADIATGKRRGAASCEAERNVQYAMSRHRRGRDLLVRI